MVSLERAGDVVDRVLDGLFGSGMAFFGAGFIVTGWPLSPAGVNPALMLLTLGFTVFGAYQVFRAIVPKVDDAGSSCDPYDDGRAPDCD